MRTHESVTADMRATIAAALGLILPLVPQNELIGTEEYRVDGQEPEHSLDQRIPV